MRTNRETATTVMLACAFASAWAIAGQTAKSEDQPRSGASTRGDSVAHADQRIEVEVEVAATPEQVFDAWTTRDGVRTFFAPDARIELRIGGAYEMYFMPAQPEGVRGSEGCRILSYEPAAMLSFDWNAPPTFPHARQQRTWVVVRLSDAGPGRTRVHIAHLGWEEMQHAFPEHADEWQRVRAYFDRAWRVVAERLQKRFESGPVEWPNT